MPSVYMLFVCLVLCYALMHSFYSELPPENWTISSLLWCFRALLLLAAILTLRDVLQASSVAV